MSATRSAPGELELVRSFVNTNDIDDALEHLGTPEMLREWMSVHGLDVGDRPLTKADVHRAQDLREALRALLLANGGERLDRRAIDTLNAAGQAAGLRVSFERDGASALSPQRGGLDGALAAILGIVYRAMAEGTWPRLKACRADDCQWAFY